MSEPRGPTTEAPKRNGVWRRGPSDWAYRVTVAGYGSVAGLGFASREEARAARRTARKAAEARARDSA